MNGRIYDGRLGRFLQADPQIQEPNNSQSLNRYSYVLNNPLSYTDPTGYNFLKKYWRAIVAIVATYITAGYASGWAASWGFGTAASGATAATLGNTIAAGAISGFVGGGIATGSLKGAVIGAFTGAAFGALHNWQPDGFSLGKVAAHGGVGGVSSVLSGGKFGHGFAAAGFTQAASQIGGESLFIKGETGNNAVKAALIGGTASALSGGKFANGAITGAFSRLLNDEADWNRKARKGKVRSAINNAKSYKATIPQSDWESVPMAVDISDLIPGRSIVKALEVVSGVVFDDQVRTVLDASVQNIDVYEYDTVYDLDNGKKVNEERYNKQFIKSSKIYYNKKYRIDSRTCVIGTEICI